MTLDRLRAIWLALAAAGALLVLPESRAAEGDDATQRIVVTGSNFRFGEPESTPLQVITRTQIERSGLPTLSDVIRAISADNNGTLTQAFAGAFAGGASGIALRGLSVGSTLVLLDGRRVAAYPLSDDGQRSFVDLSSLPLALVDRIEILKDGASAVYGSDAVAGVVNIITRREQAGAAAGLRMGVSSRRDGETYGWHATLGAGDLAAEGYSALLHFEGRQQHAIWQLDRGGTLSNLDLRGLGGPDLRAGVVLPGNAAPANFAFTLVGMVAPLDADRNQIGPFQLLPGCPPASREPGGGCVWNWLTSAQIQPPTKGLNLGARLDKRVADGWVVGLTVDAARSSADQWFRSTSIPQPTQTDPRSSSVLLPPDHPDNPFGPTQGAILYYEFGDVGARIRQHRTQSYRVMASATGQLGGWAVDASLGYSDARTRTTFIGFIRESVLASLLASGTYRVGVNAGLNSAALYEQLAPRTEHIAKSTLGFADVRASRELVRLPAGPVQVGVGAEVRRTSLDNPPQTFSGDILGSGISAASGASTTYSAFAETHVPLAEGLVADAAVRHERYVGAASYTAPKVALKWQAAPGWTARGSVSRGFRMPSLVESSDSGLTFFTTYNNADRCPTTQLPADCQGPIMLTIAGNPQLKPETSVSRTAGIVLEPSRSLRASFDAYWIERRNEVVISSFSSAAPVFGGPDLAFPGLPPPLVGFDLPFVNASSTRTSGFDVELNTRLDAGASGRVTTNAQFTRIRSLRQRIDGVHYEFAGTHGPTSLSGNVGTPKNRARIELLWQNGPLEAGGAVNYIGGFSATDPFIGSACLALEANPSCRIKSFTTADLYLGWRPAAQTEFGVHVRNLFDARAPLDTVTYGGINYNPSLHQAGAVGRQFALTLAWKL